MSSKRAKSQQFTLDTGVLRRDVPDPRNPLNDLTNTEWMFFTRSVWITTIAKEIGFDLRKKQGGNKPPRLMAELIKFFTKKGQRVLDPMAGVGGSLLGAALCDREALGIELNPEWVSIYRRVCKEEGLTEFAVRSGDALERMDNLESGSFDFVVIDPPYREDTKWDRTMCDETYATRIANLPERFSADERDFGNILDYERFLLKIYQLCKRVHRVLKEQRYFVLFCKDEYQNGEYIEKSSALAQVARTAGFAWKGKIVWYQAGAKLRPYGVPYSFVPNLTHQCILVFKKNGREIDNKPTEGIPEVEERQTIVRP